MIADGLGILPIACYLHTAHPGVIQPWYADDARSGGTFGGIYWHLDDLMVRESPQGYFLESTKTILVVPPWNFP